MFKENFLIGKNIERPSEPIQPEKQKLPETELSQELKNQLTKVQNLAKTYNTAIGNPIDKRTMEGLPEETREKYLEMRKGLDKLATNLKSAISGEIKAPEISQIIAYVDKLARQGSYIYKRLDSSTKKQAIAKQATTPQSPTQDIPETIIKTDKILTEPPILGDLEQEMRDLAEEISPSGSITLSAEELEADAKRKAEERSKEQEELRRSREHLKA